MKCLHACRFCGRILYIDLSIMEDAVLRKSDFNSMREPPPLKLLHLNVPMLKKKDSRYASKNFLCFWYASGLGDHKLN